MLLKWAGGKSNLLPIYRQYYPKSFNRYFDPFVGGGSVFMDICTVYGHNVEKYIGDLNEDLISAYIGIRDCHRSVLEYLEQTQNTKEYYLSMRSSTPSDRSQKTARFIYLNKTCFNSLYRVNKKGIFNVPFGNRKNPNIADHFGVISLAMVLSTTSIRHGDYMLPWADNPNLPVYPGKWDFVYFDPPYDGVEFDKYTVGGFGSQEQARLASYFKTLNDRGAYLMLSNKDTELIRELYAGFNIININGRTCVAGKRGRKPVRELLITNY